MGLIRLNNQSLTDVTALPFDAGKILQIQYDQLTTNATFSTTARTNQVVTSLPSVSITPSATNSIIRLDCHVFCEFGNQSGAQNNIWFYYRDTTKLGHTTSYTSRYTGISMSRTTNENQDANSTPEILYMTYFDTPNTTSAIDYKIGIFPNVAQTLYINQTVNQSDLVNYENGVCFISATEIAG